MRRDWPWSVVWAHIRLARAATRRGRLGERFSELNCDPPLRSRLTRGVGDTHHRRCVLGGDIYAVRRRVRVTRGSHDDQAKDDVTGLLIKLKQGDKSALDALIPLVYGELCRVASARLRGERAGRHVSSMGQRIQHDVRRQCITVR